MRDFNFTLRLSFLASSRPALSFFTFSTSAVVFLSQKLVHLRLHSARKRSPTLRNRNCRRYRSWRKSLSPSQTTKSSSCSTRPPSSPAGADESDDELLLLGSKSLSLSDSD
uniref:Uncharacterized protein n=1 Tax=Odontella aurita TaxID=265563 RepID=A0A7S4MYG0_9STRA